MSIMRVVRTKQDSASRLQAPTQRRAHEADGSIRKDPSTFQGNLELAGELLGLEWGPTSSQAKKLHPSQSRSLQELCDRCLPQGDAHLHTPDSLMLQDMGRRAGEPALRSLMHLAHDAAHEQCTAAGSGGVTAAAETEQGASPSTPHPGRFLQ